MCLENQKVEILSSDVIKPKGKNLSGILSDPKN